MSEHLDKNLPQPTTETAAYWDGCRKHQLLIQRCTQCGHYQFYPRVIWYAPQILARQQPLRQRTKGNCPYTLLRKHLQ